MKASDGYAASVSLYEVRSTQICVNRNSMHARYARRYASIATNRLNNSDLKVVYNKINALVKRCPTRGNFDSLFIELHSIKHISNVI